MGFLDELMVSLKNERNQELILPDALTFPTLDVDKLDDEIGIEINAKIHGEKNLPDTKAKEFDFIQEKIIEFTLGSIRPFLSSYSEAIVAYNARLAALDPLGFDAKIRGLSAKKKAEIKMIATQARGEIYLHENNLRQREFEYQEFKNKHGNPADPVINVPTYIKYIIVFALVVLEGTLNSFFLGDYMKGGILEGLAYALVIPLLSVTFFGFIAGISLRKMSRANFFEKICHSVLIIFSMIGSISVTLILASLRIAVDLSEDYQELAMDIWLSFIHLNPIHAINTPGMLLVALGVAFFIVAVIDVKSLDHTIPGFIQSFKNRENAHHEYNKKMEEINRNFMLIANSTKDISDAFDSLQAWQIEYNNILINRRQLMSKFFSYIKLVEGQVNGMLSKYRQFNVMSRSTPPPSYFSNKWSYPEMIGENFDDAGMVKDFKEKLNEVYKNIELIQKEVEEDINHLSNVIIPIGAALSKVDK